MQPAGVENDKRFQVFVSNSRAETIVAISKKRKPLDDVRVPISSHPTQGVPLLPGADSCRS